MVEVAALSDKPRLFVVADRVATGVPTAIPVTPNCAELVATPPSRKSWVVFLSVMAPFRTSNGEPPFATGRIPVTSADARSTAEEVIRPFAPKWAIPVV